MIHGQMDIEEVLADMAHVPTAHEVETFTGQYVDTQHPTPDTINPTDIAHALSQTCRYGGHCQTFYSVAEHAVFVSERVKRRGGSRALQLAALHHDDAEAYLGDIPRPMKSLLGAAYSRLTNRMDGAIIVALQLEGDAGDFHHTDVKNADNWALLVEARHLLPSQGLHWFKGDQGASTWGLEHQPSRIIVPDYWRGGLGPHAAKHLFISRHQELTN